MATYTDATKVPGDWLKWEEDGWFSRDNAPIAAGSGAISSGTVMKLTAGKLSPMATTEGASAAGILLFSFPNSTADQPAAYIARDAIVADKALVWKAGVVAGDKTAAIAALKALGIQVREAV
jgi:Bacteriophage lambda head decoration protein D